MATMAHRMMLGHRLRRDSLGTVCRCLRIAGRLLYAAGRCLSLRRGGRRLLSSRISASRRLVSLIGGVDGTLCRIRLVRRTSREQRKGQHSPGKSDQFTRFSH
jgi:hypothetical protein